MSEKMRDNEQRGDSDGKSQEKLPAVSAGKRILLVTFGCQMNVRDSEVLGGILEKAGFKLVDSAEKADVILLNTCSVRQLAEEKVWSEVGRLSKAGRGKNEKLQRTKPIIGVIGCMAQNYKEAIFERAPAVDFITGPQDISKVPGILKKITSHKAQGANSGLFEMKIWETAGEERPEEIYHTGFYEDKEHAFVVISEGCSNFCSYCVVPFVRGPLRHRHHEQVIMEIETAVKKGIKNITLLGQNVSAYMSQSKQPGISHVGFIELLKMVNEIKGLKEFSFVTSHPKDTPVELFRVMQELDKLKKYLHLPVQSGSDNILKLMNRNYTRDHFINLVKEYRKAVKSGKLTTDIIVGFPGENKEDFKATLDLVKKVRFDAAFIFKYSPRPHTQAANLDDDVSRQEKERRHAIILELQKRISKKKKC